MSREETLWDRALGVPRQTPALQQIDVLPAGRAEFVLGVGGRHLGTVELFDGAGFDSELPVGAFRWAKGRVLRHSTFDEDVLDHVMVGDFWIKHEDWPPVVDF